MRWSQLSGGQITFGIIDDEVCVKNCESDAM